MNAIKYFMTTFYFLSIRCHFVLLQLTKFRWLCVIVVVFFTSQHHSCVLSVCVCFFSLHSSYFSLHSLIVILFVFLPFENAKTHILSKPTDFIFGQIRLTLHLVVDNFFFHLCFLICLLFARAFALYSFVSFIIKIWREKNQHKYVTYCEVKRSTYDLSNLWK